MIGDEAVHDLRSRSIVFIRGRLLENGSIVMHEIPRFIDAERLDFFSRVNRFKGMLQNSTFVGLALPLFLITFFSYLVWLQFFPLLKPVNYSSSRWFLECFRR